MRVRLPNALRTNLSLLTNATSLIGTTGVTSGLGFAYWWLAARLFASAQIGLASALVSAMMLLGSAGVLGFGTLLIGELPQRRADEAGALIASALCVAGGASFLFGLLFALAAPWIASDLGVLASTPWNSLLFAGGVGLAGVAFVADQALIGLMRGALQLWRNTIFAMIKLLLLLGAGLWIAERSGLLIYATWILGALLSLLALTRSGRGRQPLTAYLPRWQYVRGLGRPALLHHWFNLSLQAPSLLMPLIITSLHSASLTANFYVAWMLASLVFTISSALTTVLYAVGSASAEVFAHKVRFTLGTASLACLVISAAIFGGGEWALRLFGHGYAAEGGWCLRLLALGSLPMVIKNHYVAIQRTQRRLLRAALLTSAGGALEVVCGAIGATYGDLTGLALGWLAALCLEAAIMGPVVVAGARFGDLFMRGRTTNWPSIGIISGRYNQSTRD